MTSTSPPRRAPGAPLALLALLAGGCAGVAHETPRGNSGSHAIPQPPPPSWDGRLAATGRRAVVIAADQYSSDASWNLPNARRSAEAFADGLRAHCGFAKEDITLLEGRDVNRDMIRLTIQQAASATGEDRLLLVYYAGHGWSEGSTLQLFSFATEANGARFLHTISRDEIVGWLAAIQTAGTPAALIVDACRPNLASPPPRARLLTSDVWEVYGVQAGGFAAAGGEGEAFPFTASMVESLATLAQTGGTSRLDQIVRNAKDKTLERTGGKQQPELLPPRAASTAPELVVPKRVSFAVRVVDRFTDALLENVTLRVDDRSLTATDGVVKTMASPTQHTLTASCEGYMARTESVVLSDARNGGTLTLALLPAAVLVRGRVEPAATVKVRVRTDGPVRDDYHVVAATSRADGTFELRVPRLQGDVEVLIDEQVARKVPLPTRASGLVQGMPYVDVVIGVDGVAGLERAVAGAPEVAPAFTKEIDRKDWERVVRTVEAGQFGLARATIATLPKSRELEAWSHWIDNRWVEQGLRDGLRQGIETGDWGATDEVLAWLPTNEGRLDDPTRIGALRQEAERERIPLATRRALSRADEANVRGDFELAWTEYRKALEGANAHYRTSIQERMEMVGAQLYDRSMNAGQEHESNGDLEQAVQAYNRAAQFSERAMESVQRVMRKLAQRAGGKR